MTGEEGGWRDVMVLGDCEEGVVKVCELCGWEELGTMGGVQRKVVKSASPKMHKH